MYKQVMKKIKVPFGGYLLGALLVIVFAACSKSSPTDEGEKPGAHEGELVSLSIKSEPTKKGYFIGESFSTAGLVVESMYDDGKTFPVSLNQLVVTGFDSTKSAVQQTVKLSYGGKSVEMIVQIYPFKATNGTELTAYVDNGMEVVIPSGITKIAADVFINKSMESVTFPETLQEIGEYAFFSCRSLKNVTLPASLRVLGEGVFDNCGVLVSADLSKTAVTSVSDYLFSRCPKVSDVKLPPNTVSIGSLAFSGAVALKNITIPANTRFIGLDAFRESGLESISLPNNIKVIRQRAFLGCSSLKEVTTFGVYTPVSDDLSPVLEAYSFERVPALTKFEIPQGITKIESIILSDCPLLTEFTIPASVQKISFHAFINTVVKKWWYYRPLLPQSLV